MLIGLKGKNAAMMLARLKGWQLTDANGTEGDSLTLTISSDDIDGIPPKGEKYKVYLDDVFRDEFQISKRTVTMSPREVRIVLSVAPFHVKDGSAFRKRKSCSWDKVTLSQVVSDCVTPHGYDVFIHPKLQKIIIEHIDCTDESSPAFLRRLAGLYDAIAKPVDNVYVIAPKGEAKSATGKKIETITLSLPADNYKSLPNFVNVDIDLDGRSEFKGVKGFYVSPADGKRHEVKTGSSPFKSLAKDCNSQSETEQKCSAELRKIGRQGRKYKISAPADPLAFAEGIVVLDSTFPDAFQGKCSIDSVVFTGRSRQARTMEITATLTGDE